MKTYILLMIGSMTVAINILAMEKEKIYDSCSDITKMLDGTNSFVGINRENCLLNTSDISRAFGIPATAQPFSTLAKHSTKPVGRAKTLRNNTRPTSEATQHAINFIDETRSLKRPSETTPHPASLKHFRAEDFQPEASQHVGHNNELDNDQSFGFPLPSVEEYHLLPEIEPVTNRSMMQKAPEQPARLAATPLIFAPVANEILKTGLAQAFIDALSNNLQQARNIIIDAQTRIAAPHDATPLTLATIAVLIEQYKPQNLHTLIAPPNITIVSADPTATINNHPLTEVTAEQLFKYASEGNVDFVKNLITILGNDNPECSKALCLAANRNNPTILNILLEGGIPVNTVCTGNITALYGAAFHNSLEAVSHLLKANADPNIKNTTGYTAVHAAISVIANMQESTQLQGRRKRTIEQQIERVLDIIALLANRQAKLNEAENTKGVTPLMFAAKCQCLRLVNMLITLLLEKNENVLKKNWYGETYLDYWPELKKQYELQKKIAERTKEAAN